MAGPRLASCFIRTGSRRQQTARTDDERHGPDEDRPERRGVPDEAQPRPHRPHEAFGGQGARLLGAMPSYKDEQNAEER